MFASGLLPNSSYQLRAQFASANNLQPGSPVRIAGVQVGTVDGIDAGPHSTSVVTMKMDKSALPLRTDATLEIVPKLLLEGSFYIRLDPGSPGAQELKSKSLVPVTQTTDPVQLDQVFHTFDAPTRTALTDSIGELAAGLGDGTSGATTLGEPAGFDGLRDATRELDGALADIQAVAHEARGTQRGDLAAMIHHTRDFVAGLGASPTSLSSLVSDYDTVISAFADRSGPLQASIAKLDETLKVAPAAFTALHTSLPSVERLADAALPALRAAPDPLRQTSELLDQFNVLAAPQRLPALLDDLRPVTSTLPALELQLRKLMPLVNDAGQCIAQRVVPAIDTKLDDGKLSTGDPAWMDLLHAATGITSATGGFDGNGSGIRAGTTNGSVNLESVIPGLGKIEGIAPPLTGVRPEGLAVNQLPPFRPDARCVDQPQPNLQAGSGPVPRLLQAAGRKGR